MAYFKFERLTTEQRITFKIKSEKRIDCTATYNSINYRGLDTFINYKGMMYLYPTTNSTTYNSNSIFASDISLSGSGYNFSSILTDCVDCNKGYGYPNPQHLLSNGKLNPLYNYKDDLYLFIFKKDLSTVEVIVVLGGKKHYNSIYQAFLTGEFDYKINELRSLSRSLFDYSIGESK